MPPCATATPDTTFSAPARALAEGEIDMRSGHLSIHRVGAYDGRAVTLHVYAKPIDACRAFEEDGSFRIVASHYDSLPAAR